MDGLARALREEAKRANERRVLVLAGSPEATREAARDALDVAEITETEATLVGPADFLRCEHVEPVHAANLLGRTRTAIVLDAHEQMRPNVLGGAVGAVDGGGLLLLLTPSFDDWVDRRDDFEQSLAAPPFTPDDVTGHVRVRVVELLAVHPGIAVVDADTGTVERNGLTDPAPGVEHGRPDPPDSHAFPGSAYDVCLTADQVDAVKTFERLRDRGQAVVVEADRGRGKSSAAGLAAASLALDGNDVLVTAPRYRNAREVFDRASELLTGHDAERKREYEDDPHLLTTANGCVRFERAESATALPDDPDVVIVDEAAALPVRTLERFLESPAVAFTTTVHGYEGAGRGFSVRFRERLAESDHDVTTTSMVAPIRYAPGDPVESWAFRTLMFDARPAVEPLVEEATTESVSYCRPSSTDLVADEHVLREVFGLLVLAHYRTEPDDLARLLDAPNITVRALAHDGHVVSVALLAREGNLPADLRADVYAGARVKGNMIPDVLTTQLRDEDAGIPVGQRVLRIATHPAVQSRGLGSRLLTEIQSEFADSIDWLGVGYGVTPDLVQFWHANGYETVHLSTTRNDTSGEHSAIMLDPCSAKGRTLADRHGTWFLTRIESVLSNPLCDLDPDVVRIALRSTVGQSPLDLSPWEWRLVAGVPGGTSTFDTNISPFRKLVLHHLTGSETASTLHAVTDPDGVREPSKVPNPSGVPNPAEVPEPVEVSEPAGVRETDEVPGPVEVYETDEVSEMDEFSIDHRDERLLVRAILQGHSWDAVAAEFEFVSTAECLRSLTRIVERLTRLYGDDRATEELEGRK